MSTLTATRPTDRKWLCAAMPAGMLVRISGATTMRTSRRNRSPGNCACAAMRGNSSPNSIPASMAKKVQASRVGLRRTTTPTRRSVAPRRITPQEPCPAQRAAAPATQHNSPATTALKVSRRCLMRDFKAAGAANSMPVTVLPYLIRERPSERIGRPLAFVCLRG